MAKKHFSILAAVALLWGVYTALTFFAPAGDSGNPYNLSPFTIAVLRLTIVLPYLLAWLAGAYAALTLQSTVRALPLKEDALAYRHIAIGVTVLVGGMILSALVSSLRNFLPDQRALLTIINNYVYVLVPLAGFWFILKGSGHLRRESARRGNGAWPVLFSLLLAAFAVVYVWLIFTNPTRQFSSDPKVHATYFLPDAAIALTIVLPFLVTCALALISLLKLSEYYRSVTGYLYKRSALNIIVGLIMTILASLFLQALLSLGSTRLSGIGLGMILVIVYVFIGLQSLGFFFLALGAKKLSSIERVMQKYERT